MDIYYRGFDSGSPISSATKHITAFAARLVLSICRSVKHLDDAAYDAFMKVVTVENLWAMCLILAGWVISSIIGGPIGAAVSAILLYLGVREFYDRITEIYQPLKDWLLTAYHAKEDKDLETAAQHFATGLASGAMTVLEFVVLHKLFRATEAKLLQRFAAPDWLRTTWDRTVGERMRRRQTQSAQKVAEKDKAGGAVPVLAGALQAQGLRRAARGDGFPLLPVAAVGAALVVSVGVVSVALTTKGQGR
jgi:hypothetical protein